MKGAGLLIRSIELAAMAWLCLVLLMVASDCYDYFRHRQDFIFGSEVGGLRYASPTNFLALNAVEGLVAVAALAAPVFVKSSRTRRLIRIVGGAGVAWTTFALGK